MKKMLVLAVALALMTCGMASAQVGVKWFDNFESYANTAALSGPYTQIFPAAPLPLDQIKGYQSNQSIKAGPNANSTERMWINIPGGPIAGTDAMPIKLEFMMDIAVNNWHTREYIEIRSNAGGSYNAGALQDIIAVGFTSSGVDTTRANYRIVSGPNAGWGNYTLPSTTRAAMVAADWTKMTTLIKSNTIEFYVNDVLDTTKARNPNWTYDSIVIGSGLSTNVPVWFDDLKVEVVPEPASMLVLGTGLVGLVGVMRRRRS